MKLLNKKDQFFEKIYNYVSSAVRGVEIFLACLLIISVLIAAISLIISLTEGKDFSKVGQLIDYNSFQQLLSYILLLIIALELAIMLIKHSPNNVVEIMIYAIARKMLIYNTSSVEMLIGVITLAILFITKIYIIQKHSMNKTTDKQQNE